MCSASTASTKAPSPNQARLIAQKQRAGSERALLEGLRAIHEADVTNGASVSDANRIEGRRRPPSKEHLARPRGLILQVRQVAHSIVHVCSIGRAKRPNAWKLYERPSSSSALARDANRVQRMAQLLVRREGSVSEPSRNHVSRWRSLCEPRFCRRRLGGILAALAVFAWCRS